MSQLLFKSVTPAPRALSELPADMAAARAIVQAAVNVELFTIPLYMTSMYSIQGMHQINGQNEFYLGRKWPGMATSAKVTNGNQDAFNKMFSVFIAEMLHLQLAANICKTIGVDPSFNSPMLQNENYGWTCYGPRTSVIPHVIDLMDTIAPYSSIRVNIGPLSKKQNQLFLAIEETEAKAKTIIRTEMQSKYFPSVPFANWTAGNTEKDLPLFGSIGAMYLCLWEYFSLEYTDGEKLWHKMFVSGAMQQDIFNAHGKDSLKEYPGIKATVTETESDLALLQIMNMINAITDQGEGSGVVDEIRKRAGLHALRAVKDQFRPNQKALEEDYPSYTDKGKPAPSADAAARGGVNGALDHYETFQAIQKLLDKNKVTTWDQWHAKGKKWTPDDLKTKDYAKNKYNKQLPTAAAIAGALNDLKRKDVNGNNFIQMSQAAIGAIAGVTTVLNKYWQDPKGQFPYPSMAGSGDRMSICWAIFGQAPDLSLGIEQRNPRILYHACQGMNLDATEPNDANSCAMVEVYHTCKGSNSCRGEGGCGFVQSVNGGTGCGAGGSSGCGPKARTFYKSAANLCGGPKPTSDLFSAPSDNACGGLGGCAVPISASQMYPAPAKDAKPTMQLYNFVEDGDKYKEVEIGTLDYKEGELVYDVAWEAYCEVLKARQGKKYKAPKKPKPGIFRLAFPPST